MTTDPRLRQGKSEFQEAGDQKPLSLVQEFAMLMAENKKWWLLPILLSIGAVALLIALGSTGAAPFIYTLF